MKVLKVSICIPTWNRNNKLVEIIELLENQSIPRNEYEIIVIDSNSPDGTDELMTGLCTVYSNLSYLNGIDNVLSTKRNVGLEKALGDVIILLDDDVYPCYEFVESHYKANKQNVDTFYCGQVRFPKDECKKSNYYRFRDRQYLDVEDKEKTLSFNKIVVMNCSFKKEFINVVGGFDERFIGYGCEDTEFGYRLNKKGFKLKYLDTAIGIHQDRESDLVSYGRKWYKVGLYGQRVLNRVCPEALSSSKELKKSAIGYALSVAFISKLIELYLRKTDKEPALYSYYLYKAYLYSRLYKGRRDQKKYPELSVDDVRDGW